MPQPPRNVKKFFPKLTILFQQVFFQNKSPDFNTFPGVHLPKPKKHLFRLFGLKSCPAFLLFHPPLFGRFQHVAFGKRKDKGAKRYHKTCWVKTHVFSSFDVSRNCGGHLQSFRVSWNRQSLLEENRDPEGFQVRVRGGKTVIIWYYLIVLQILFPQVPVNAFSTLRNLKKMKLAALKMILFGNGGHQTCIVKVVLFGPWVSCTDSKFSIPEMVVLEKLVGFKISLFPKIGVPQNRWVYQGKPPIKLDDLGGKPPIFGRPSIRSDACLLLWSYGKAMTNAAAGRRRQIIEVTLTMAGWNPGKSCCFFMIFARKHGGIFPWLCQFTGGYLRMEELEILICLVGREVWVVKRKTPSQPQIHSKTAKKNSGKLGGAMTGGWIEWSREEITPVGHWIWS